MISLVDPKQRPVHWYMDIDVPSEELWALFSDYRRIKEWWPLGSAKIDFIGDGIGMIRNIYVSEGVVLSQRLEAIDEANNAITSSLLNCEDFGLHSLTGTSQVKKLEFDWTRVTFTAQAVSLDPSNHELQIQVAETYLDTILGALKKSMESRGAHIGTSGKVRS